MDSFNEFIKKYDKLPIKNELRYYRIGRWDLKRKDSEKYFDGSIEKTDFLWQSVLFSFYSKIIYTYSLENYKFFYDFFNKKTQFEVTTENIFQKLLAHKLTYFIDEKCRYKFEEFYNDFYHQSVAHMDQYVDFLTNELPTFSKMYYCDFNLLAVLKDKVNENEFLEEFSRDEQNLSNIFLQTLQKSLK